MILQCMSAVSQCLKNLTTSQLKCKLRKTDGVGSLWCELEQLITIHTTSRPANLTATFISRRFFFLYSPGFFSVKCSVSQRTNQSTSSRLIPGVSRCCTGARCVSYQQVQVRFAQWNRGKGAFPFWRHQLLKFYNSMTAIQVTDSSS